MILLTHLFQNMSARELWKLGFELTGVFFGLMGTWFISRRYARHFMGSFFLALLAPLFLLLLQGRFFRKFIDTKLKGYADVPDNPKDMSVGLILLFWSFVFQFASFLFEIK